VFTGLSDPYWLNDYLSGIAAGTQGQKWIPSHQDREPYTVFNEIFVGILRDIVCILFFIDEAKPVGPKTELLKPSDGQTVTMPGMIDLMKAANDIKTQ
jgi:hypothetical protein